MIDPELRQLVESVRPSSWLSALLAVAGGGIGAGIVTALLKSRDDDLNRYRIAYPELRAKISFFVDRAVQIQIAYQDLARAARDAGVMKPGVPSEYMHEFMQARRDVLASVFSVQYMEHNSHCLNDILTLYGSIADFTTAFSEGLIHPEGASLSELAKQLSADAFNLAEMAKYIHKPWRTGLIHWGQRTRARWVRRTSRHEAPAAESVTEASSNSAGVDAPAASDRST